MTDRPARCPRCGSPDPAFTKLNFGGAYAHYEHLVSGWGHPLCPDAWHDRHRPWYDEWKAKQARFQPTPPPLQHVTATKVDTCGVIRRSDLDAVLNLKGRAPTVPFITEEIPMSTEPSFFYVEDRRSRVGNCMTWWAKDGNGYTCNLDRAHRFTLEELRKITRETDYAWPAGVVLAHAVKHVDHQALDPWRGEHAVAGDKLQPWLALKARAAAEEDLLRLDEALRQRIDKWDALCRSACPQPDGPATDADEAEARVYAQCAAQLQAILDGRDPEEAP